MAHTKIASQTSFKGLFLQKVGTKLHGLRFCMSKPNFLQKKVQYYRFSLFLPICLCCIICLFAVQKSVFLKCFGADIFIHLFACLHTYVT